MQYTAKCFNRYMNFFSDKLIFLDKVILHRSLVIHKLDPKQFIAVTFHRPASDFYSAYSRNRMR